MGKSKLIPPDVNVDRPCALLCASVHLRCILSICMLIPSVSSTDSPTTIQSECDRRTYFSTVGLVCHDGEGDFMACYPARDALYVPCVTLALSGNCAIAKFTLIQHLLEENTNINF